MDLGLKDKIVFISGSGRGIGLATAKSFLQEGARVIINSRSEEHLNTAVSCLQPELRDRVFCIASDALTEKGSDSIVDFIRKKTDSLDCFVANLGGGKPMSTDPLDERELRRFFDLNVMANAVLLNKIHPILKKSGMSSVVFVSSIVAREVAKAPSGYGMSKSAVLSLSKYLSYMWADDGIRVNCVLPGNVFFQGGRWDELLKQDKVATERYIKESVPMKRFGKPEEVASLVSFLLSDAASYITGEVISINGGLYT